MQQHVLDPVCIFVSPFLPLVVRPPRFSPCSLLLFPLFFPRVCHLVLASPLTNPPVCMQFLEHTHGAQCPCNCAAVALLTRVLWSRPRGPLFQPGHSDPPFPPCPKTTSLPLMRHGLGWATVLRQRDAFLSCFNLMVRPPSDPFLSLCSSASC